MAVFAANYTVASRYTRDSVSEPGFVPVDIHHPKYVEYVWIYIFNGVLECVTLLH